jgi:hypothetical protein
MLYEIMNNKAILKIRHQPSGGSEWVAELVGADPKFEFKRNFLKPIEKEWSRSGKTGLTMYEIEEGKIYEYNEPWRGREFITLINGQIVYLTKREVEEMFKSDVSIKIQLLKKEIEETFKNKEVI